MGREPQKVLKTFVSPYFPAFTKEVELFTWEKLDYIEEVKKAFGI
jgi:S-adenosylmethionine synthetase